MKHGVGGDTLFRTGLGPSRVFNNPLPSRTELQAMKSQAYPRILEELNEYEKEMNKLALEFQDRGSKP